MAGAIYGCYDGYTFKMGKPVKVTTYNVFGKIKYKRIRQVCSNKISTW